MLEMDCAWIEIPKGGWMDVDGWMGGMGWDGMVVGGCGCGRKIK